MNSSSAKSDDSDVEGSLYDEVVQDSRTLDEFQAEAQVNPTMSKLNQRIKTIREASRDGKMSSYGDKRDETLQRIQDIRKTQISVFKRHMALEMSFPTMSPQEDFSSKQFSDDFQKKFQEKEAEMDSITAMLQDLTKVMSSVNDNARTSNLAQDPIAHQTRTSMDSPGKSKFRGVSRAVMLSLKSKQSKSLGRASKPIPSGLHSQSNQVREPWMHKLDLDATKNTATKTADTTINASSNNAPNTKTNASDTRSSAPDTTNTVQDTASATKPSP